MLRKDAMTQVTYIRLEKERLKKEVRKGHIKKEQAWDFLMEYIDRQFPDKCTREKIEEYIFKYHPNANKDVIKFILDFNWSNGDSEIMQEAIRHTFRAGYCYYFAVMLKTAFNRGEVCWCAPYGHICWVDVDGIPYDVEGVCESDCDHYIPISFIKEGLIDFLHVPGKEFGASKEYINEAIERYKTEVLENLENTEEE